MEGVEKSLTQQFHFEYYSDCRYMQLNQKIGYHYLFHIYLFDFVGYLKIDYHATRLPNISWTEEMKFKYHQLKYSECQINNYKQFYHKFLVLIGDSKKDIINAITFTLLGFKIIYFWF